MIEDLENIYIYIEDNLDIQFEPDLRQLGKWAPSVYICINQKKELTCITINGDKSVYETKHMDRLPDVIKSVMDRDSLTSLTISDYDILDICSKYKITPEIDDEKYDDSYKTDIGIGVTYYGRARYVLFDIEDLGEDYLRSVFYRKIGRPLQILTTDRLLIREMCLDDMEEYVKLYDSLKGNEFVEELYPYDEEVEFVRKYIENMYTFFGYGLWLVFLKDTGELIGRVGIENREIDGVTKQELGYLIGRDYQRKGYAYEACSATIEYARTVLNMDELFVCIHRDNRISIDLAEKLGFILYARNVGEMNLYKIEI